METQPQRNDDSSKTKNKLKVVKSSGKKQTKKKSSYNYLTFRVNLNSSKFEIPIRDKIGSMVRDEIMQCFSIICSHCNRHFDYDMHKQTALFLINSVELTEREKQIMDLVVLKKSDLQISRDLGISINTVKNHIKHIKTKLGVHSRSDARNRYVNDRKPKSKNNFG